MTRITSFVLALAMIGCSAAGTRAADIYGSQNSYGVAAPGSTWSGPYAGALLGYGWGDSNLTDTDGFVGGLTAGYNFQHGPLVLGLEGDLSLSGIGHSSFADSYDVDWLGTGRGRIGYAFDRFMVFGTGGFAWTRANYRFAAFEEGNNHFGWALGAGAEVALNEQLSAKVDYLYHGFEAETYLGRSLDPSTGVVRFGLNYQF